MEVNEALDWVKAACTGDATVREAYAVVRADIMRKRLALQDLFLMMDENILVRNTDDDAKPDYALRMLSVVQRLKDAHAVSELSARPCKD